MEKENVLFSGNAFAENLSSNHDRNSLLPICIEHKYRPMADQVASVKNLLLHLPDKDGDCYAIPRQNNPVSID